MTHRRVPPGALYLPQPRLCWSALHPVSRAGAAAGDQAAGAQGCVPEGPAGRQVLQTGPSAGSQRAWELLAECGPVGELSQGGRWELGAPSDATTWEAELTRSELGSA